MTTEENIVRVSVLDSNLRIACPKAEEARLREAAQLLDKKLKAIRQSGKVIGLDRIMLMAALNFAHELLSVQAASTAEAEAMTSRLQLLHNNIDNCLSKAGQ